VRAGVARAMPGADVRGAEVPSGAPDQPFGPNERHTAVLP
jgi:non-canonical (house-cleaning) NTP pyrophosphatase